ncbi:MAG TPA: tetratricopeptide repeat protein [Acidobacteriaceae bacterium]
MQGRCQQPTPVRDADSRCVPCHAAIVAKYLRTPMANASGVAAEQMHPGVYTHVRSNTRYEIALRNQTPFLTANPISSSPVASSQIASGQASWEAKLQYFLGSGHLGTTYLYWRKNYLFESPVAWFARSGSSGSDSFDMKPGFGDVDFFVPGVPMQSECLRCHMSAVQPTDSGSLNRYTKLPFLHTGITCEACHGNADFHVRSKGKSPIVNPAKLDPWLRDSVCLSCHLEGDVTVKRAGRSALNYRPGEPISDYLAFFVKKDANATARGVSEVEQLAQSRCKRISGDGMSCTSCHDPHDTPDAGRRVAFFRAKCLSCHSQPEFKNHHVENQDCTSCHMPRSGAANIQHVAWTDHRILRLPDASTPAAHGADAGELTPIFSPGATARDLAMANYKYLLEGDASLAPITWRQLSALRAQAGVDKDLLNAFGNMAAVRGDSMEAEAAFHEVLQNNPDDLIALSNLGVLLAKHGRLEESEAMLQKAFDRNEDDAGLAMNLIRVECINGQTESARATLNTALAFNPHLPKLTNLANQIPNCNLAPGKE